MKSTSDQQAVAILVMQDDGKILGLSRGSDMNDWNLPGGKVEEGELPEAAAFRELREETGLEAETMIPVFGAQDGDFFVTTFVAFGVLGTPRGTREGQPRWITANDILDGSFAAYNRRVFQEVGIFTEE